MLYIRMNATQHRSGAMRRTFKNATSRHFREIVAKKQRPTEEAGLQALLAKDVEDTQIPAVSY